MKHVIALLLAATLTACATQTTAPLISAAPVARGVQFFGTLAPLGSFEWQIAPAYTRNAALRHRAAALLDARRITIEQAREVLTHTDRARMALDAAVKLDARGHTDGRAAALGDAARNLQHAEAILKDK